MRPAAFALLVVANVHCGRLGFQSNDAPDLDASAQLDCDADSALAYDAHGQGTLDSPFVICAAAQFIDLSNQPTGWASHYRMLADINLVGLSGYQPIGDTATPFTGTFDGGQYTIHNFSFEDADRNDVGVFGAVVGASALIANLGVENVTITGRNRVGGLIGGLQWGSVVHTYTTGRVSGRTRVGGAVGSADHSITISTTYSTATVQGTADDVGGLIGQVDGGRITRSYATGNVSGSQRFVGGLIGRFNFGAVIGAYATGDVVGGWGSVGGMFGTFGSCLVSHAFATGNISCDHSSDICGVFAGSRNASALPVLDNVAHNSAALCMNAGAGGCNAGDGVGIDLNAQPDYFQLPTNEPLTSWETDWSQPVTWLERANDYPALAPVLFDKQTWGTCLDHEDDAPFAGGSGTVEDPYLVCTAAQLLALSADSNYWSQNSFRLMNDIDMSNLPNGAFQPIGTGPTAFRGGALYGNGKVIRNLAYNDSSRDFAGLFGAITYSLVKRLGLEDVAIVGKDDVGALAGLVTRGNFVAVYSSGTVEGTNMVGGLLGRQHGRLANSYSIANVIGTSSVGGLTAEGGCDYCFATGDVTTTAGSRVGRAHGNTSTANSVYYDANSQCSNCDNPAGIAIDVGGAEPTDYFYRAQSPPFATQWDFVHTWRATGTDYPILR